MIKIDNDEIVDLIEHVVECKLGPSQLERLNKRISELNDPRRGYQIIATPEDALYWLSTGNYRFGNFEGGIGLFRKDVGGCWGYFKDGLIEQMVKDELITEYGTILKKGYAILSGG